MCEHCISEIQQQIPTTESLHFVGMSAIIVVLTNLQFFLLAQFFSLFVNKGIINQDSEIGIQNDLG